MQTILSVQTLLTTYSCTHFITSSCLPTKSNFYNCGMRLTYSQREQTDLQIYTHHYRNQSWHQLSLNDNASWYARWIDHGNPWIYHCQTQVTLHKWQQLASWINWSLNVFLLLRPALNNFYTKISGNLPPTCTSELTMLFMLTYSGLFHTLNRILVCDYFTKSTSVTHWQLTISHVISVCITWLIVVLYLFIVLNKSWIFPVSISLKCHKISCHTTESIFLHSINLFWFHDSETTIFHGFTTE